jgi:hypothetical protein
MPNDEDNEKENVRIVELTEDHLLSGKVIIETGIKTKLVIVQKPFILSE